MRGRKCLPFESTWVHPRFLGGVRVAPLFVLRPVSLCTQRCQCLWIAPSDISNVYFVKLKLRYVSV
jgi:hypothetical protein